MRIVAFISTMIALFNSCPSFVHADDGSKSAQYVLMVNGGYDNWNNHLRYFENIKSVYQGIRTRGIAAGNISVLYGSGDVRDTNVDWGASKTRLTESTLFSGDKRSVDGPANKESLTKTFDDLGRKLKAGDDLLLYITDHGADEHNESQVVLWGQQLSIAEFRELLAKLPPGVTTQVVTNICYGGGLSKLTSPNVCVMANQVPSRTSSSESTDLDLAGQNFGRGLSKRIDMDGDGHATIYDAYLYSIRTDNPDNEAYSSLDYFLDKYDDRLTALRVLKSGTLAANDDAASECRLISDDDFAALRTTGERLTAQLAETGDIFNTEFVPVSRRQLLVGRLKKQIDEFTAQHSGLHETRKSLYEDLQALLETIQIKSGRWMNWSPSERELHRGDATLEAQRLLKQVSYVKGKLAHVNTLRKELQLLRYGSDELVSQYTAIRRCLEHEI